MLVKLKSKDWEIRNSSLVKDGAKNPTYEECRKYACEDILKNLTRVVETKPFIYEFPRGASFNFLIRVDTNMVRVHDPKAYYDVFEKRSYISFSTICNQNVSHYGLGGNVLFAYNLPSPDLIAHIFPMDSDTDPLAKSEDSLTELPSLWLKLQDLNSVSQKLKTYPQITAKTKFNGEIIKPFAVIALNELDDQSYSVANEFGLGIVIVHPNKNAICETFDPFFPVQNGALEKTKLIEKQMKKMFSINVFEKPIPMEELYEN